MCVYIHTYIQTVWQRKSKWSLQQSWLPKIKLNKQTKKQKQKQQKKKHSMNNLCVASSQRQTGHSGVVVFATWTACFGAILELVAYKVKWGKQKCDRFVKFTTASISSQPTPASSVSYIRYHWTVVITFWHTTLMFSNHLQLPDMFCWNNSNPLA